MTTYIALLRGINIGGHNKISMAELVSILEDIGCFNVRTYIQSGNIIFNVNKITRQTLAKAISRSISEKYGFAPMVVLLTWTELENVINNNPFPTDHGKALHFLFLEKQPDNPDLNHLKKISSDSEKFQLGDRVFYLYVPDGIGQSKLAAGAQKYLGVTTTGRNWNTVCRLAAMLREDKQS